MENPREAFSVQVRSAFAVAPVTGPPNLTATAWPERPVEVVVDDEATARCCFVKASVLQLSFERFHERSSPTCLVGQGALRALPPARAQGQARRPRAGPKPRALRHRGPGRLGPHDRGQRRPRLRRAVPRVRAAPRRGHVRRVVEFNVDLPRRRERFGRVPSTTRTSTATF